MKCSQSYRLPPPSAVSVGIAFHDVENSSVISTPSNKLTTPGVHSPMGLLPRCGRLAPRDAISRCKSAWSLDMIFKPRSRWPWYRDSGKSISICGWDARFSMSLYIGSAVLSSSATAYCSSLPPNTVRVSRFAVRDDTTGGQLTSTCDSMVGVWDPSVSS